MTAKVISSVYRNCQRPPESHTTLQRYFIPRIQLLGEGQERKRITVREQNPFIRALMAMSIVYHLDVGEKKATALYDAGYKTMLDIAYAGEKELCKIPGVGKTIARGLLQAITGTAEGL